jgi:DNA modification methylase
VEITYLQVEDILQPTSRQREEVPEKHVEELRTSILENGLFHSITITEDKTLVAGDCRLRALKLIAQGDKAYWYAGEEVQPGWVPCTVTHKEDRTSLFKIELEENLRRKNLSPLEEASAIAQLHNFLAGQGSTRPKLDTAEKLIEFGQQTALSTSKHKVANALILDQFKDDPEVRAARTEKAAVRIAKRKMEQNVAAAMGAAVDLESLSHKIFQGDAHELLSGFPDETYDGIITDPPYGIDAQNFGEASFLGTGHEYQDSAEHGSLAIRTLATQGFRICKQQAHIYVFCDIGRFAEHLQIFTEAGWTVWKTPLIWYKGSTAHAPRPDYGPKRAYEAVLFAAKGDKKIQYCGLDVIVQQSVFRDDKLHPAEKPVGVYAEFLKWSFIPGSLILDPFCGSGPIFPAASEAEVTAHGIEMEGTYFNIARSRMAQE